MLQGAQQDGQKYVVQNALTVIVPIKPDKVQTLRDLLVPIGNDIEDNPHLDWRCSPSTHFARFVILDPVAPGGSDGKGVPSLQGYPSRLLFTSNYDGTFETYMQELVEQFGSDMEGIWSQCQGYPPGAAADVTKFTQFIYSHSHLKRNAPPEAFYVAQRGASVQEIWQSIAIRDALNKLLDSPQTQSLLRSPSDLVPRSKETTSSATQSSATQQSGRSSGLVAGISAWLGAKIDLGARVSALAEWMVGIRSGLNPNLPVNSPETQLSIEDRVTQNQMTVIVPIRPDFKAKFLLPLVLKLVNGMGAKSTGSLSGLTTIHFARWAIIDRDRNLLFESNFDGSWENYIDDFVDRASLGMNIIWGNCTGFPRGGCKDIEWFKKYIRDNQIPAQVFYSAYRDSSIKNNLNDIHVAQAVRRALSAPEIEELLNGSYQMTESMLKRFLSDPTLALFLSGSYNCGVTEAVNSPQSAAKETLTQNRVGKTNSTPPGAKTPLGVKASPRVKKSAVAVGVLTGLGLLSVWWMRRKSR